MATDDQPTPRFPRRRRTGDGLLVLPADPVEAGNLDIGAEHERRSIIDSAIYVGGERVGSPATLAETYAELSEHDGAVAWIGLYRPDGRELSSLARAFGLHDLAVEDAVLAHQRPKLERYGDTLFVVLRAARYVDASEEVEFGEVHLFVGQDFVVTVRHSEAPDLAVVRRRLEQDRPLLELGAESILYAILDSVVDGYAPVVRGLENDIDEIETQIFIGDRRVSRRIYELTREVIEFQRATRPLVGMLQGLTAGFAKYRTDEELQRYLRDVEDHVTQVIEQVDGFRQLLSELLTVNATLVAQQQNEEMKNLALASNAQNDEVKRISVLGRDPLRADPDRRPLRDELRAHAGARLAARLCVRAHPHVRQLWRALPALPAPRLALSIARLVVSDLSSCRAVLVTHCSPGARSVEAMSDLSAPTPSVPPPTTAHALGRRALLRGGAVIAGTAATSGVLAQTASARGGSAPALIRSGRPTLTSGVQSGDVHAGRAVLWSRADRPSRLVAELSTDPGFRRSRTVRGPVVTPQTDLTGQFSVRGLPDGADVYYRVRAVDLRDPRRSSAPVLGHLRTPARSGSDVRFLWSGDIAGQGWGVNPDLGGFRIADAMRRRDADFFLCSGDNVYADGPLTETVLLPDGSTWRNLVTEEKSKVAETLADYRGQYRYNLMADNWRAFLAETSQVTQWDDHEVLNNWYPGEIIDDPRYTEHSVDVLARRARRAFHDYVPVAPISPDPEGRVYRVIHHSPLLDLFVLDMRTHKDPNTTDRETVADGGLLGRRQTRWLIDELARSRATWKVIANDLPLGLVVPDATLQEGAAQGDGGAPLGRELDISQVLTALQRLGIRNHVWLTADVHYTAAHHYSPERASYQDFDPFWEFVSGPLNAGAFGPNALDGTFGPQAMYVAAPPRANTSPAEGSQFFGEVGIDAVTRQLTVTLRDVEGQALFTQTLDPRRR